MKKIRFTLFLLILISVPLTMITLDREVSAGGLSVLNTQPEPRDLIVPTTSPIIIHFDKPINRDTITKDTFWAFGRWSGTIAGNYSYANKDKTVILTPSSPFSAGEQVMVLLGNQIEAEDGSPLRSAGYSFQFWTKAAAADMQFEIIDVLSTRTTPSQSTRSYGGVATDFNNDGWVDLTIVNEDTGDLRVFLNKADGTGLFHEFIKPPTAVNDRASPSEPSDFNRDGFGDIAVVNINTDSVSILLGNGDGTFAPQQEITVGDAPRGIAVLDVDGDGDTDIVNTNSGGTGSMSLLINDGNGVFAPPIFFDGGGQGEYALAAADMNEDMILDLVIGGRNQANSTILVNTANGDGTFTFVSSQSAGGAVWMINTGDVNGDGHEDVASANSDSNNGAILWGNGLGNLLPPVTSPTDPFPLATDLGDIDGDGDLDWITSSFFGDWNLFLNNGGQQGGQPGTFTFETNFPAAVAASCALFLDFDNDGDLDLALIDEIADEVILIRNNLIPPPPPAPVFLPFVRSEE